jgi:hypothetical protein
MSQNYTPRKATEADLAAIEALISSAYEKYIVRIGRKPKPMVADYRKALADHEICVLEHDQSLDSSVVERPVSTDINGRSGSSPGIGLDVLNCGSDLFT